MSARIKRISVDVFEKGVAEAIGEPVVTIDWHGVSVFVRKKLPLIPMIEFVNDVVGSCFDEDTHEYKPEIRDFAIRCAVLTKYANFSLPKNIEHCYELVVGCDVYPAILDIIDQAQFREMLKAVDDKIAHIASANIEAAVRQVDELYSRIGSAGERLGELLNGLDADSIRGLVSAMSDNRFDPDAIVKAYMKQKKATAPDGADAQAAPDIDE